MNPIHHSVITITYNQEQTIRETIESVLSQSVKPWEYIIVDDASQDKTWEIISDYQKRFPTLIKAFRNPQNKGIFRNFNDTLKLPNGDFINYVSGDDLLPADILAKYENFILENRLDTKNSFCIFSNSIILSDNSHHLIKDNKPNFSSDKNKLIENILLQSLYSWDTGLSKGLIKRCQQLGGIRTDIGYQADAIWNVDKVILSDKVYFIDSPGYIYRQGVGVTVSTEVAQHYLSRQKVYGILENEYNQYLSHKTKAFMKVDLSSLKYFCSPNLSNYFRFISDYFSFTSQYKFKDGYSLKKGYSFLIPISIKAVLKRLLKK